MICARATANIRRLQTGLQVEKGERPGKEIVRAFAVACVRFLANAQLVGGAILCGEIASIGGEIGHNVCVVVE
jgi:hypothetical protein